MNRNEKRLLRDAIRMLAHNNRNAWWELKRQIFESGYQSYYPIQGDFDGPAERAIAKQSDETKTALIAEWRQAVPTRAGLTDSQILVVERARLAASRTENW